MTSSRLRPLVSALFAVVLLLSACSSSDGSSAAAAADQDSTQQSATETSEAPEVESEPTPSPEAAATEAEPEPDEPAPTATAEPQDIDPTEVIPDAEAIDWRVCGEQAQCGFVDVPADYDDPNGDTIKIAVSVHRTADLDARLGYLFVNPGGPGFPGTDLAVSAQLTFTEEILESFDIIGFDPRGVGQSEPTFACGVGNEQADLLLTIDSIPDTDEEIAIGNQAAQLCVDSMGPVGARLHSEFVARDMDQIRQALGAEQISYLGFSYGSALGGWYATLFPERVYSMAVDGAANPLARSDEREEQLQNFRDSVGPLHDQLAAAIASCDETCPIWNDGNPEGYWYEIVDKFELVREAVDGDTQSVLLGIVGHLYSENTWPVLHDSIFKLGANDDPSGFVDAIVEAPGDEDGASLVAHINCLDQWALFPEWTLEFTVENALGIEDEIDAIGAAEYPLLDALDLPEQGDSCVFYESIDPPVFEGTFDGGDIPILVIGNVSDPFTSYVRSEQYANDVLADGRLVQADHPSHVVYPANSCVNQWVHSALIDQEYPDEEIVCESDPGGVGDVSLVPLELPDGATSVRPESWRELSPGIFAKGDPSLQPVLLFQPTFGGIETTVASIEELFAATAESGGEIEVNGVTWSVYEISGQGLSARFAMTPGDNGTMILGQSLPDELEELTGRVLIPAVEAFEPAG